jgi:hypothetical protein
VHGGRTPVCGTLCNIGLKSSSATEPSAHILQITSIFVCRLPPVVSAPTDPCNPRQSSVCYDAPWSSLPRIIKHSPLSIPYLQTHVKRPPKEVNQVEVIPIIYHPRVSSLISYTYIHHSSFLLKLPPTPTHCRKLPPLPQIQNSSSS